MTVAVIINPKSGRQPPGTNLGTDRESLARRMMASARVEGEVILTRARGHGAEIAAAMVARGVDRVVAWGGDGTINEIAGPLIRSSSTLGIVPAGSGDGLARGLGLRKDAETSLRTALTAPAVAMDVGFLGGRHFLNIAGVGFDAEVGRMFNQRAKRGGLGYASIGLRRVWSYQCGQCRLELDGVEETGSKFLVAFANGSQYGNGIVLCSEANAHDGWLDVVVVDGGHPLQLFWRARRLFWRRNAPASGMRRLRVKSGSIAGDELVCHVDGETFEARGRVEVRLEPGVLRVAGAR